MKGLCCTQTTRLALQLVNTWQGKGCRTGQRQSPRLALHCIAWVCSRCAPAAALAALKLLQLMELATLLTEPLSHTYDVDRVCLHTSNTHATAAEQHIGSLCYLVVTNSQMSTTTVGIKDRCLLGLLHRTLQVMTLILQMWERVHLACQLSFAPVAVQICTHYLHRQGATVGLQKHDADHASIDAASSVHSSCSQPQHTSHNRALVLCRRPCRTLACAAHIL